MKSGPIGTLGGNRLRHSCISRQQRAGGDGHGRHQLLRRPDLKLAPFTHLALKLLDYQGRADDYSCQVTAPEVSDGMSCLQKHKRSQT